MTDIHRTKYGLWVVLIGIGAVVVIYLVAVWRWSTPSDVATVVSAAGAVIGTLVGAFFGLQFGAAGREESDRQRDHALAQVRELVGTLEPQQYRALRQENPDLFAP